MVLELSTELSKLSVVAPNSLDAVGEWVAVGIEYVEAGGVLILRLT